MSTETEEVRDERSAEDLTAEAEALAAISRAMGAVSPASASRIAAWAKSLAPDEDHLYKALTLITTEVKTYRDALQEHYRQNVAPSKADARLYVAILGHDKVRHSTLAALYAEEETTSPAPSARRTDPRADEIDAASGVSR